MIRFDYLEKTTAKKFSTPSLDGNIILVLDYNSKRIGLINFRCSDEIDIILTENMANFIYKYFTGNAIVNDSDLHDAMHIILLRNNSNYRKFFYIDEVDKWSPFDMNVNLELIKDD